MTDERRIAFSWFSLDLSRESLLLGSQPVPLRPKTFAVLRYLLENPHRLIAKEELLRAVWPKTRVVQGALKVSIGEIRKALGDGSAQPKFIETVGKKGYRFIAPVSLGLTESGRESFVPFVGRAEELDWLRHYLELANSGKRQLVFVTGEPGIGKTTLVEAFTSGLSRNKDIITTHGQCIEQYGSGEAYLPILDALERLCNGPNGEPRVELLRRHAPSWLANLPGLIEPTERSFIEQQMVGITPERRLREITSFLETLAQEQTVLLVLEDLHWLDPSTLALISFLGRRREAARLMLIGTYRAAEVEDQNHPLKPIKEELELHHCCSHLPLKLLTRSAVGEYLAARFETPLISSKVTIDVYKRSEGNPLFMVGVTDYMIARESITQHNGSVELDPELSRETTPTTLRQLIERQFERLSKEDQELFEVASVRGASFSAAILAAVLKEPLEEVERRCDDLVEREHFLQRSGPRRWPDGTVSTQYSFIHILYQNVIYERMGESRKSRLHRAIAERLEAAYQNTTEDIAADLAIQFERAGETAKAARYLSEAAQKTFRQCAFNETLDYTKKGLEITVSLSESESRRELELTLQLLAAAALSASKGYASPETKGAFDRSYTISRTVRNDALLFQALAGFWSFHLIRGEIDDALKFARRMLDLAGRNKSQVFELNGYMAAGCALFYQGHPRSAYEHLEKALRRYDFEYHRKTPSFFGWDPGVVAHCYDAQALWFIGLPARAEQTADRGRVLAKRLQSPFNEALCCGLLSIYYAYRDDGAKLLETTAVGIKVSTEGGFLHWLALTTLLHGSALCKTGRLSEGVSQLREGIEKWRSAGAELGLPVYLGLLAHASMVMGKLSKASDYIEEAFRISGRNTDRHYDAELCRLQGELALAQRARANRQVNRENAEAHFRRAIELARLHESRSLELRATLSLCRLWQKQGKEKQARQKLRKIYSGFTEGFDAPDLKNAKALLEE